MQLRYSLRGALWLLIYLIFILAPLFALLIGTFPSPPRDFWGEFASRLVTRAWR
jgi:ABC-type sulfate transport system permease component